MDANPSDVRESTSDETHHEKSELQPDERPQLAPSEPKPRPRGFAAMDRSLVREIARKGGKAAHAAGTAHEFTGDEARVAGRKGGQASHARRRERLEKQVAAEK
jgi:general stress protein YciG